MGHNETQIVLTYCIDIQKSLNIEVQNFTWWLIRVRQHRWSTPPYPQGGRAHKTV